MKKLEKIFQESAEGVIFVADNGNIKFINQKVKNFIEEYGGKTIKNIKEVLNEWPPIDNKIIKAEFKGQTLECAITFSKDNDIYIITIRNLDAKNGTKTIMKKEFEISMNHFMHDLMTPLNATIGLIEVVKENLAGVKGMEENVNFLNIAMQSGLKIIRQRDTFRLVKKIEDKDYKITKSRVSLFEIIKKNKEIFITEDFIIHQRPILQMDNNVDFDVMLDVNIIDIALQNAIKNAIEATPYKSPKEVFIEFGKFNEQFAISITNYGEISEENMQQIFKKTFTTKEGGSGIGTKSIKLITEAHGGKVSAKNEEGKVRITMTFPQ